MIEKLTLIAHVLTAAALIGLILVQQGKGADMGASFGSGASQTLFGSTGSAGFLTRLTAALAALFFVTSFTLAIMAKHRSAAPVADLPTAEQTVPADASARDVPTVDAAPAPAPAQESTDIPAAPASE